MLRSALAIALALAACERADPVPPPRPPAPPPADAAPPPVDAAPPEPAECRGAALDVVALADRPACSDARPAPPLPPGVTVALAPAHPAVASGGQARAAIELVNTTARDAAIVLDTSCERLVPALEMRDAAGRRVDVAADEPAMIRGCIPTAVHFTITPGGVARIPFSIIARQEILPPDHLPERTGRKIPPGTYQLSVAGPVPTITASVTVE